MTRDSFHDIRVPGLRIKRTHFMVYSIRLSLDSGFYSIIFYIIYCPYFDANFFGLKSVRLGFSSPKKSCFLTFGY
eukprot:snap_masked-scaffold_29-processed-gene-3.10-mRNA-1 protein AED:1.00 eAED:1.00 QI:0/0/0/0/1/1/2/0/74